MNPSLYQPYGNRMREKETSILLRVYFSFQVSKTTGRVVVTKVVLQVQQ